MRGNGSSVTHLNASVPGAESIQAGSTSCHSISDPDITINAQRYCGTPKTSVPPPRESIPACS
jgi:hypothetical protein